MSLILLATEKPFAKDAVDLIRNVIVGAGHEMKLLENYTLNFCPRRSPLLRLIPFLAHKAFIVV